MFIKGKKTENLFFQNWVNRGFFFLELKAISSKKKLIYVILQTCFEITYILVEGLWTMSNKDNRIENLLFDFEIYIQ